MDFSWDDLRLFLDVARLGGLTAATATTGLSAATLGRRVTALERQVGEPLFVRSQTGYRLTPAGDELLLRAEEVEAAMLSLKRWKDGAIGERVVRVSAGPHTSAFLARNIGAIWTAADRFGLELVTANQKVDIGRRNADIGIRNQRPTEQWLAGRLIGRVAYALYARPELTSGVAAGYFVGTAGDGRRPIRPAGCRPGMATASPCAATTPPACSNWSRPAPASRCFPASWATAIFASIAWRGWFPNSPRSNGSSCITRSATRRRCAPWPTGSPR